MVITKNLSDPEWGYRDTSVRISRSISISDVRRRVNSIKDELLARILYIAAHVKKREDQLRRTTRDLHTRTAVRFTLGFVNIYR